MYIRNLFKTHKKHFYLFIVQVIIVCVISLFAILSIWLCQAQVHSYFIGTFEKRSLSQLGAYHQDVVAMITDYFKVPQQILTNVLDKDFLALLEQNNGLEIQKKLDLFLKMDVNFNSVVVQDSKGIIKYIATENPVLLAGLGKDFSKREYFINAIKNKKPFISPALTGIYTQTPFISISYPLMKKESVAYVLSGFITLDKLNKRISLPQLFYERYSLLTDINGGILLSNTPKIKGVENIGKEEPLFAKLKTGDTNVSAGVEYNYVRDRVFAQGEVLKMGGDYNVYLFTFLKTTSFDNEKNRLEHLFYKTNGLILIGWFLLNIFIMANLHFIVKHYDTHKAKTKTKENSK